MNDVRTLAHVRRRRLWARRWVAMRRLSRIDLADCAVGYAALGAVVLGTTSAVRGFIDAAAEAERRELVERMWEQA